MKRNLRLWEYYALIQYKLKHLKIKYFGLLAVATIMCLYAHAQRPEPSGPVPSGIPTDGIKGLVIGDSVPKWFWDVELGVVNHPEGDHTVSLGAYRDKLLVLDFWATYCSPCVKSLDKWNCLQQKGHGRVTVLGIHLFHHNHVAGPFAKQRGWSIPIAVGNRLDTLLNDLFYARRRFGQVWIKDGKLLAIPKNRVVTAELVDSILADKPVRIEMEESHTYFDPALTQSKNTTN